MQSFSFFYAFSLIFALVNAFPDWLIENIDVESRLRILPNDILELTNGLISRQFTLKPGFATINFFSHEKKSSLLRAIQPEAILWFDGIKYSVGGLNTLDMSRAYLNRTELWEKAQVNANSLKFVKYETRNIVPRYPYTPKRGVHENTINWPPKGIHLKLHFKASKADVTINYELFDNVPFLSKWVTVKANQNTKFQIEAIEKISLNWQWSQQGYGWLQIVPDQPHGTKVQWIREENNEPGSFQPLLQCGYDKEFSLDMKQGDTFESYKVLEVLVGSSDHERKGLALRKLKRLLAPQSQENPIYFHMTNGSSNAFRNTVDQLAEVGFEMVFYSFGSGFNLEAEDISGLKADIAYANSKGLEVGGYDLIAWTRKVSSKWLAITNETIPSACMASGWYDYLLQKVKRIRNEANLTAIETDGPYPGYSCASSNHAYHQNGLDSTYHQTRLQSQFYIELHKMGMYINQPDDYFYFGANKAAMGYNEGQFSLPRWVDLSVSRQGMFDDTYRRIPSEGWMFLPLTNYEGGGPAAWFEPLNQHKTEYDFAFAQYFGAGVQACYRGDRVYDGPETKAIVQKWINFYKAYRYILNGDLIHIRRADMQTIDAYLHVRSERDGGIYRGLAMIFNPTSETLKDELEVPLYYTGLNSKALVILEGDRSTAQEFELSRNYKITISIILKPKSYTWILIQ